jgi:MFS family permease
VTDDGRGGGGSAAASLLGDPAFLRVWLTGAAAGVLRWLELLAISVYVLEVTGSPFLVALMTFLRMAPMFLCGIPAGALADRYDRKRLLLIGLLALAGAAAALTLLAAQGRIALWQIAAGTFLNGMSPLFRPVASRIGK